MAALPALSLLFAAVVVGTSAVKIADMDQGAEFTKCLNISDWQTKTLADYITLFDRMANGCCPKGTLPGHKFYTAYKSPQIVCGFKADGSIKVSITSGTNAKCEYNKCYVDKQNLACADDSKQLLNGCCAKTTYWNSGFPATCKNYYYAKQSTGVNGDKMIYCTTYHKSYSAKGRAGTTKKDDDQAAGKLVPANIDTYATCDGSAGGATSGTTSSGGATSGTTSGTVATVATTGTTATSSAMHASGASIIFIGLFMALRLQ
jgi:hypothetical protein